MCHKSGLCKGENNKNLCISATTIVHIPLLALMTQKPLHLYNQMNTQANETSDETNLHA